LTDYGLLSNQSSVGMSSELASSRPPLDLGDFMNTHSTNSVIEKQSIDNEIFYLEREIFDFNQ
jgi:hypothetical protein